MTAVRDVTITIPRDSITGVVGESGCGKSTLARLVLRLIEPTAGRIHFDGADLMALRPDDMRRLRRRMQMVFQDPYSSLDPRFTIADVLAEPFRVQGDRVSAGAIADLLEQVGLAAEMAGAYPHQLSGGQRQRVGVARALAQRPDFVVLDEPTASLDVSIQAQIFSLLERLKGELGLT
ncbi:MAG: dipeptide/oligopeptide/nickel ABC transporter ATP-binding protein, partial [Verrucomicrobia bacterium]|nr:dipeptide/oligopeptide/nickel ABC transporter ATP-binding protein [Verrucomicrobiota bacterium]